MKQQLILIAVILLLTACTTKQNISCLTEHLPVVINHELARDVELLSAPLMAGRKAGTEGSVLARKHIIERFKHLSIPAYFSNYEQPFDLPNGERGVNVVALLKGSTLPNKIIVVTAHYDHLGERAGRIYLGADDNATGVAAMLALARALVDNPPRTSVLFVATDAEEKGLLGAKALLNQGVNIEHEIVFNYNLDMLGRAKRMYFLSSTGKQADLSQQIFAIATICSVHRRFHRDKVTGRQVDYLRASDHWAFAKKDIDFLFVGGADHRDYHLPSDSPDKILKQQFSQISRNIVEIFLLIEQQVQSQYSTG
ncbi:M20/M25/M40 family metallo-hydrolase [Psychrobium sp. 1_MG-2023]|uniref:M20/M25/M40 family metallo-hydrolase n=1 Tax=Psychrobium sp. 1_MG-2023 TaxID=3062624 RepID=UPI000C32BF7A|nr:M20/M25/M40 family metallo-hydrolase [Psychrobium sp. 1_MG-2023]MDP2562264.1 M20/M25/M40 family metallo-hydrolase [Psychrobium sp. 1_MG-2023]PKF57514.1 hypothetical protein CW748_06375 [Alteromonadales bacterium alter-6D02]